MTSVSTVEFQNNLGKYLLLAAEEDILIRDGEKVIARLTAPLPLQTGNREQVARSLFGIIPPDVTLEEAREERLRRI